MGTEAVVVQVQVLKGHVGGKKSYERGLGVEAKGIVVEVDGGKVGEVQDSGKDGGNAGRDLVQQSAGEKVGEVGGLGSLDVSVLDKSGGDFRERAYLEALLGGQDFTETLASTNTERVAPESHFFDVIQRGEGGDVRLDVFGGVELEPLALEGEDLGGGHFAGKHKVES